MSKRVLITGASSGIGREFARVFARERYELILVARDKAGLDRIASELKDDYGTQTTVVAADLTDKKSVAKVHQAATAGNKPIDVLVNNAGIGDYGNFADSKWDKTNTMLELNIIALTYLTRLALPDMIRRKNGKILNVASTAAFFPGPLMSVYYATKAYVMNFSLGIAQEVKQHNITVTTLCPGPTRTRFHVSAKAKGTGFFSSEGSLSNATSVAYFGYNALVQGKPVAVHGFSRKVIAFGSRFLSRSFVASLIFKAQGKRDKSS